MEVRMQTFASFAEFSPENLSVWCRDRKLPEYRVTQLLEWVYRRRITDYMEMTNLPAALRTDLTRSFPVLNTGIREMYTDTDGTRKFVFNLLDGHAVETVFMPTEDAYTLCISSQVGCALGCRFCATGTMGIIRNLTPGEIVSQILHARHHTASDEHGNIVFMGMGEPLLNTDAVIETIQRVADTRCLGWSPRRITVSTAGIVPEINRLARLNLGINLAVSLNAADDAIRSRLMPINKKYPLKLLMSTLREYPLPSRQHQITYEYIMLRGINDDTGHADKLTRILDTARDKINLIPFNPVPGSRYACSEMETILQFQERLRSRGFVAQIRNSRGSGIMAACGQLAGIRNSALSDTRIPPGQKAR